MPAIDIAQVRAESAELARLYPDPNAFAMACLEFCQAHGLPVHKRSNLVSIHTLLKTYETPPAVIKTLVGAIRKLANARPQHALVVADRLWKEPVRELRIIAAELGGIAVDSYPDQTKTMMDNWLVGLDDLELADIIAEKVATVWLAADLWRRLDEARFWVISPHKYLRYFGLTALSGVAQQRNFADAGAVLNILGTVMRESDVEVRKAVVRLLRRLAESSPATVTTFLAQWAEAIDKNTNWIVRQAMIKLDPAAQQEIMAALRGGAPS